MIRLAGYGLRVFKSVKSETSNEKREIAGLACFENPHTVNAQIQKFLYVFLL